MPAVTPRDVVVVMDPIAAIKIAKDSTFAMLLEAQRRGHRLHYVRPGGLALHGMRAIALAAPLEYGTIDNAAARAPRKSFSGWSCSAWLLV